MPTTRADAHLCGLSAPRLDLRSRGKLRCRPSYRRSGNHRVRSPGRGCCKVCYVGLHRCIHFRCRRNTTGVLSTGFMTSTSVRTGLRAGGGSHERTRLWNQGFRASFWHFIPAPNAPARARAATKIPPLWADLPPRRTRVRNEMLEPSGGFNVKAGVAGVWPAQTRQAPWLSSHPVRQPLRGAAAPQGLAEDQ
jgi:hypothetical protein